MKNRFRRSIAMLLMLAMLSGLIGPGNLMLLTAYAEGESVETLDIPDIPDVPEDPDVPEIVETPVEQGEIEIPPVDAGGDATPPAGEQGGDPFDYFLVIHKFNFPEYDHAPDIQGPLSFSPEAAVIHTERRSVIPADRFDFISLFTAVKIYSSVFFTIVVVCRQPIGVSVITVEGKYPAQFRLQDPDALLICQLLLFSIHLSEHGVSPDELDFSLFYHISLSACNPQPAPGQNISPT